MRKWAMLTGVAVVVGLVVSLEGRQVTEETVAGVRNFKRLETTVACAGATSDEAMPALKKMGYASVVNLRLATEEGVNIDTARAAAQAVGLRYVHVPFSGQAPDPVAADRFLAEIARAENQPAFIHCAGGGRAATMWMIKRIALDKWDVDRASAEATALGMSNAKLREWAIQYAKGR